MVSCRTYNSPEINPDLLIPLTAFNHSILYLFAAAHRIGLLVPAGEVFVPVVGPEFYRPPSPHAPYPRLAWEVHIVGAIVEKVPRWRGEVNKVIPSR